MVKHYHRLMLSLLAASDIAAAGCSWLIAYYAGVFAVRLGFLAATEPSGNFLPAVQISLAACVPVFARMSLYEPKRTKTLWAELSVTVWAVVVAWGLMYVIVSLADHVEHVRFVMISELVAWLVLAVLSRTAGRIILRRLRAQGWNIRYTAIVGTGRLGQTLFHCLKRNKWTGIEPAYFVQSPWLRQSLLGIDVLGPYAAIEDILASRPVDIVFVALPAMACAGIEEVLGKLANTHVDVRIVPDMLSFQFLKHDLSQLDDLPIVTLTHTPLQGWNSALKQSLDLTGSALGLVVLSLPMLLIALAVRLTSGSPVLYRQVRTSLGGKPFVMIKFRTMSVGVETDTGPIWVTEDDPRITRVGRLLRRTGLDELPQLVNVLLGDMSLVGPRPERPEFVELFRKQIPRYMLRYHAKAGLTGWAQVHGLRGRTSIRKRLQHDMYYLCNWSFGLDLRILFITLLRLFVPPRGPRQQWGRDWPG